MQVEFAAIAEEKPGSSWLARFREVYGSAPGFGSVPGFAKDSSPPSPEACRAAFRQHMPELLDLYERICDLAQADADTAWFLSGWCQPQLRFDGCSVLAVTQGGPLLVRAYDFSPRLFEGTILMSAWSGRRVIAMNEMGWGALDGLNEAGLAIAITFGGRPVHGPGFAIPILARYVLETCEGVPQAMTMLRRLPCCQAQNVIAVDRAGRAATAYLGPDREAVIAERPYTTNHQYPLQPAEYPSESSTFRREACLAEVLAQQPDEAELRRAFARPPLANRDYDHWFGTLYEVAYRPARGSAIFWWPEAEWQQSFAAFEEGRRCITLPEA